MLSDFSTTRTPISYNLVELMLRKLKYLFTCLLEPSAEVTSTRMAVLPRLSRVGVPGFSPATSITILASGTVGEAVTLSKSHEMTPVGAPHGHCNNDHYVAY